ncbi:CLUMA_CG008069, isoform A [Clunio marinus]|uniref:CLUMA_CG008069, isoform A n=1 Tax=Clunio marinus TaxID=568069 RepID=A0A1J1I2N4_9DIPT|nr:CLUMA_CG008069, isoform A [Clunio marinus]
MGLQCDKAPGKFVTIQISLDGPVSMVIIVIIITIVVLGSAFNQMLVIQEDSFCLISDLKNVLGHLIIVKPAGCFEEETFMYKHSTICDIKLCSINASIIHPNQSNSSA